MFSVLTVLPFPEVTYRWNHGYVFFFMWLLCITPLKIAHIGACTGGCMLPYILLLIHLHHSVVFHYIDFKMCLSIYQVMNNWMVSSFAIITKTVLNIYIQICERAYEFLYVFLGMEFLGHKVWRKCIY